MFLSIVIPAYNEEKRLPKTLSTICEYLKENDYDAEIIVVVEKSEDKTLEIVKEYERKYAYIRHLENDIRYGKGYSVRKGVLSSQGEYILFTDSDLSTPIKEIEKMLPNLKDYDCCCGQRIQVKKQPIYRLLMGVLFRYISYCITGLKFKDTQCGFKIFTYKFGHLIFQQAKVDGFAFDVEMLMMAEKMGFKVKPVEVEWFNDKESKVSLLKDSFKMFIDLIRIKRNLQVNFRGIEVKIGGKAGI